MMRVTHQQKIKYINKIKYKCIWKEKVQNNNLLYFYKTKILSSINKIIGFKRKGYNWIAIKVINQIQVIHQNIQIEY